MMVERYNLLDPRKTGLSEIMMIIYGLYSLFSRIIWELIITGYNGWIWMDGMDDGMYNKESDMIGG
jgi:hypothetical protein